MVNPWRISRRMYRICILSIIGTSIIFILQQCKKENLAPEAKLEVSPLSGESPLEVRMKVTGIDANGAKDIHWYDLNVNNQRIRRSYPIDTTITLTNAGITKVYGEVVDSEDEIGKTPETSIEVYGKPFIEQSSSLTEDINVKYDATLYRTSEADLIVERDGVQVLTKKINDINQTGKDYEKTFTHADGLKKGNHKFKLKAGNLEKETSVNIPNYNPTVNPIAPVNFLEETDTTITLPTPNDKNPEDNPVSYQNATSLDGKTKVTLLLGNKIKLEGIENQIGQYQVKLQFGSATSGLEETVLIGNLIDDTRIKINPFKSTNSNGLDYDLLTSKASRDNFVLTKLLDDWVSEMNPRITDPIWDCTEYTKQLKINMHGFPGIPGYSGDNLDSIYFYHGTLKDNGKYGLPIYGVLIMPFNPGHEMNAILTGDNAENFSDWNFIEPQFDQINVQPGQAYIPANCEMIIRFSYVQCSEVQGCFPGSVPILRFQIINNIPKLIWKTDDSNLNFKIKR